MDVTPSHIVLSTAGRDRGMYFYVLKAEGQYLLLADGKKRPVERPKRKKRSHVLPAVSPDTEAARTIRTGGIVKNSELRRDLAAFRRSL